MKTPWEEKLYGRIEMGISPYTVRLFPKNYVTELTKTWKYYLKDSWIRMAIPVLFGVGVYVWASTEHEKHMRKNPHKFIHDV